MTWLPLRLAWRETRGGWASFWVLLACLALGVGAIAAIGELAAGLEGGIRADARRMLGGDLELRQAYQPLPDEVVGWLEGRGRLARLARLRVMARPAGAATGKVAVVELKAVDQAYPLVGRLELRGRGGLQEALAVRDGLPGAVVEPQLLTRLGVEPGDQVAVGSGRFRITGVIAREPDRATDYFGLGPRMIVSQEALAEAGLGGPGSLIYHVYKLALDPGLKAPAVAAAAREAFPQSGWRVRDYTTATTFLGRMLDNLTLYLTLVSLAALLVGGVGVAGAVEASLTARQKSLAAMKALGAGRGMIFRVYLTQTLLLALAGSLVGVAVGSAAALGLGGLLASRLGVAVAPGPHLLPALIALGCGLLTALAFSLGPLSAAGRVSPARLFRGYADPDPPRPSRAAYAAAAGSLALLLGLIWLASGGREAALGFALAVVACGGVFWLLGKAVVTLARRAPRPQGPRLAHALAGLHRPGAATGQVIFSLGLGLTALVAVGLVEANLHSLVAQRMPREAPSYFFLDIPSREIQAFTQAVQAVPGVTKLRFEPTLRGRIVAIAGRPVEEVEVDREVRWAVRSERGLTYAASPPDNLELAAGAWWPADYAGPPLISLDARMGRGFGVGVGDTITVSVMGRPITATIANLRVIDWSTLRLNHSIIFAPGSLEKAPHAFIATVRAEPAAEAAVFKAVTSRWPGVVAVYVADVLKEVTGVLESIAWAVRATSLVILAAGLLVLTQALRAGLARRRYEAVVFKVLGAARSDVMTTLALEFGLQAAAAVVVAAILGAAVSWWFVEGPLRGQWAFHWLPVAGVSLAGVGACLGLGFLGIRGILARGAWQGLRNQ